MKIRQLAAAAALVAAAPSFAAINVINDDAELFGVIWDEGVATYVIDLGVTVGELAAATVDFTLGTVGGADWDAYKAADLDLGDFAAFSGTRWAVMAVDVEGFNFIDGDLRYFATSTGDTLPSVDNISLDAINGAYGFGMAGIWAQNGLTPDPAVDGDLVAYVGSEAHLREAATGGGFGFFTGNAIGQGYQLLYSCTNNMGFDSFAPAACSTFKAGTGYQVGIQFDGSAFTVAVPEPGTYALMAAGLLAVGFVARRRG